MVVEVVVEHEYRNPRILQKFGRGPPVSELGNRKHKDTRDAKAKQGHSYYSRHLLVVRQYTSVMLFQSGFQHLHFFPRSEHVTFSKRR